MKDELERKIMTEFVFLRPKTYSYLTDGCKQGKKAKGTKTYVIKRRLKFSDYKYCLLNNEIILKSQQRFTSYHYGTSAGKVCKTELLSKVNIK